ncbi:septum formation protein [Cognatiyoonia koreensis]|uniref:dTTP/UTP pyrophosphatase n=1 Tax=Cognatiyoonia koreensis TaxID=364200 RepID=A0A1I0N934_9RHOB|nr:nucleoside triphosphate pyrophosphatase [Cognatiyoonia koreensis]SEV97724.1 septum formation protein [Cognatiyoonia koreensis]
MTTLAAQPGLKLVLGSGSPRRLELLALLGLTPSDIRPPDIDEDPAKAEVPRDYVNRVARQKAEAVTIGPDEVALCADTTVALGRRIMGKPADADEARDFLQKMSGRRHKVITAVAVKRGTTIWSKDVQTTVALKTLSSREIDWYLATQDWHGKAGGYGIQGPAAAFVTWINGSFHAVMGLPVPETAGLLTAAGFSLFEGKA